MIFIYALLVVLISLLLFTYYRSKANLDDLNRPSFFNSKLRKYFLLVLSIVLFIIGNVGFIIYDSPGMVVVLPAVYYVGYDFYRSNQNQKKLIERVFQNYNAFRSPDITYTSKEQLSSSILFVFLMAGVSKKFQKQISQYVDKRIKNGQITCAKDLPQEAWTIINSIEKGRIEQTPYNILPQKKIDYIYEEMIEGKKHDDIGTKFAHWILIAYAQFERLFKNFSFLALPRADFTDEEICLVEINDGDKSKNHKIKHLAYFPNVTYDFAKKFGWVNDLNEYYVLASLEYQRRYPKHQYSRKVKAQHKFTNQQIFDYAQSWMRIDISKIKLYQDR